MNILPPELIKTLQRFSKLSQSDLDRLATVMTATELKKGDFFLKEDRVSNHLGFLQKGIMRVYHVANDNFQAIYK